MTPPYYATSCVNDCRCLYYASEIFVCCQLDFFWLKFLARSAVFAAMMASNMTEKEQSAVQIPDFDDDVVKGMLQYLYTGETQLVGQRGPDLLRIADKYDLSGLKEDCEHAICDGLNVDNAADMLALAHMHNATLLKQCALVYIKS